MSQAPRRRFKRITRRATDFTRFSRNSKIRMKGVFRDLSDSAQGRRRYFALAVAVMVLAALLGGCSSTTSSGNGTAGQYPSKDRGDGAFAFKGARSNAQHRV